MPAIIGSHLQNCKVCLQGMDDLWQNGWLQICRSQSQLRIHRQSTLTFHRRLYSVYKQNPRNRILEKNILPSALTGRGWLGVAPGTLLDYSKEVFFRRKLLIATDRSAGDRPYDQHMSYIFHVRSVRCLIFDIYTRTLTCIRVINLDQPQDIDILT